MLKNLKYLFLGLVGFALVIIALSNRQSVTLRLLPEDTGGMLGLGSGWTMPLFVVILASFALGVLWGYVWEWLREMRQRAQAKQANKKVTLLEREIAQLKTEHAVPPSDKILAILEEDQKK